MLFNLKCDMEFEADNIVDALQKLSTHFNTTSESEHSDLISSGSITLVPSLAVDWREILAERWKFTHRC